IGTSGFKYKDPGGDQGPVKSLIIKLSGSSSFSIKAKLNGKHGTINVVPPNLGTGGCMALKLGQSAGAGDRYSVDFRTGTVKNVVSKMCAVKKPTASAVCPVVGPSTTTTTTLSTTTTTHVATTTTTSTTHASTTTTTMYGSPSRAFLNQVGDLLD